MAGHVVPTRWKSGMIEVGAKVFAYVQASGIDPSGDTGVANAHRRRRRLPAEGTDGVPRRARPADGPAAHARGDGTAARESVGARVRLIAARCAGRDRRNAVQLRPDSSFRTRAAPAASAASF